MSNATTHADDVARYARQMRFPPLGEEGQRQFGTASLLLCGGGALGSAIANTLVRAGVGKLRIVDRDFVELTNLQRQPPVSLPPPDGRRPLAEPRRIYAKYVGT